MLKKKIIVVGQGIAGAALALELIKCGAGVIVFDDAQNKPPSTMQAGGVLHHFNRKNYASQQKYIAALQEAINWYRDLEQLLGSTVLTEKKLVVWPDAAQQLQDGRNVRALQTPEQNQLSPYLNLNNSVRMISPVYYIDVHSFLQQVHAFLKQRCTVIQSDLNGSQLSSATNGVFYDGLQADQIIFCEGAYGTQNAYFKHLPFIYNKADALWLKAGLPAEEFCFENEIRIIPTGNGLFWCGASHSWAAGNAQPDIAWRNKVEHTLNTWLKVPYNIVDHRVALRPTTQGQFPFVGLHPAHKNIGIMNGLGTRGLMYAPVLAKAFAKMLTGESDSLPGYDTQKFNAFFK